MGDREKKILSLRFVTGKTQMEVAKEIGISQAQVSRLEKGALEKIWTEAALLKGAEAFGEAQRDLKFNAYFPALLYSAMLSMTEENNKWQKLSE